MFRCFETEYQANEYARKVNGKVTCRPLPDYMGVIDNWVVEWDNKEDEKE